MKNVTYYNAGAGSGKTYKLTEKLIDIFKNEDTAPENVILTTFTKVAAADFKKKTRERLLEKEMFAEASSLEDAKIGTVHSIGLHYIRKYWYILGRSSTFIEMDDETKKKYVSSTLSEFATQEDINFFNEFVRKRELKELGKYRYDFWKNDLENIIEKCDSFGITDLKLCQEKSLEYVGTMFHDADVEDIKGVIERMFSIAGKWREAFDDYKKKNNLLSFSDMEKLFLELLDNKIVQDDIRNTIKYVFVDEFQDSNQVQLKIFDKLSDLVCRSYWVGDPKQAIYRFRGCDTELVTAIMKHLRSNTDNGHEYSRELDKSWRSREPLVNLSNSIFAQLFGNILDNEDIVLQATRCDSIESNPPAIYNWDLATRTPEGNMRAIANREMLIDATASKVRDVLGGNHHIKYVFDKNTQKYRNICPSDIAILLWTNNYVSKQVDALRKYGVPVDAVESYSDKRAEVRLVKCLLSYMLTPESPLLKAEIESLMYSKSLTDLIEGDLSDDFFDVLDSLRNEYKKSSVSSLVLRLIHGLNLYERCGRWGDSQSRMKVLDAIVQLAKKYDASIDATVEGFISSFPNTIEINTNPEGVKVMTYFKSKGLEWPLVILDTSSRVSKKKALKDFCFSVNVSRDVQPTQDSLYSDFNLRYCPNILPAYNSNVPNDVAKNVENEYNEYWLDVESDSRRLFYVGMTRARDYIVTLSQNGSADFLKECGIKDDLNVLRDRDNEYLDIWDNKAPDVYCEKIHDEQTTPVDEPQYNYKAIKPECESCEHIVKYLSPSTMDGTLSGVELVSDFAKRIEVNSCPNDEYARLGTCIHDMFAVYEPSRDENVTTDAFRHIVRSHGMSDVLVEISSIVSAIKNLYNYLTENYGAGVAYKEYPFMFSNEMGQTVSGSIDLLWKTENGVVLVDYKNYPGFDDVTNPESDFYAGKYGPQLSEYRKVAEMMSDGNVQDVLVYYSVQGRLVRLV